MSGTCAARPGGGKAHGEYRPHNILEDTMSAERKLGKRIKAFREERDVSLETLAENTGLTLAFLTSLEEDDLYPTIGPLQKVARALGVRLGTFMDDQISRDPIISRIGERTADLAMHKGHNEHASYVYHSLGKGKSDRNMEPFHIEIMPEKDDTRKTSSHQGEEFMLVIKGELLVVYGRETHVLRRGDTIYYNSIVPHYVGANGDEPVEILAVVYNP